MKNKFFAQFELIPISIVLFISLVGAFMGIVISEYTILPTYLLIILIILLLVLPFLILIFGVLAGCLMIEVTEEGIATLKFGKRLKYFKWEEISEVENYIDSKSARQHIKFRKNALNLQRKKIEEIHFYFYCLDLSKMAILKQYAPDFIINKLNNKDK